MPCPAASTKQDVDTRDRILDAAENLIIERGYTATSLRAIASAADVNLAATHYHFGSKFGLLTAVFHRRLKPIDEARLRELDTLEARAETPGVEAIVRAFLAPMARGIGTAEFWQDLPKLVGRIMGEPESLTRPLLEGQFTEVALRYQGALAAALPATTHEEIRWRFHFMVGAMIQFLRFNAPLGQPASPASFQAGMEALIQFVSAGLSQSAIPAPSKHREVNT